jgi:hemoglobin-like flavoprotein
MGGLASRSNAKVHRTESNNTVSAIDDLINRQEKYHDVDIDYPLEIQIAHYTPASFPMTPVVNQHTLDLCRESWAIVLKPTVRDDGQEIAGLTAFYSEFYETLDVVDKSGKFENILVQHSGGLDSIVAKGAILLRIVNYALTVQPESERCRLSLYMLGKSHNHKQIRPWQYAVFVQVLLNTLSACLKEYATHEVMTAWVNLFAFMLRNMLPAAIKGLVEPVEICVNVSLDLGSTQVKEEVMEADQIRELRKMEKKARSRDTSRSSTARSPTNDSPSRRPSFSNPAFHHFAAYHGHNANPNTDPLSMRSISVASGSASENS